MLDSIGRNNRKLTDKECQQCHKVFRPARSRSKYCSRVCMWANNGKNQKRKPEYWWKTKKGYIHGRIWLPDGTKIHVKQHRFIAEGILGRPLLPTEDVHHRDGVKSNNSPENLEVIDHAKHSSLSNSNRPHKKGYKLNLTPEERTARSLRAIAIRLDQLGRTAKATGGQP